MTSRAQAKAIAERDVLASAFSALADPVRLQLLSMIRDAGADGVCVCNLVEPTGKSQPTVSHHLKVLREAGLVHTEKRGTWVWYRSADDALDQLRAALH
jgi:ArsR family transcriptional regulator